MSKGVFISFLLALLLLVSLASAESTGITILYPENNEVLDPGEEMVMLVFQVPEAHKEEFFNYILTDTATNEVVEADEMDVDPEDMTGVIGFDMSTFEKGGSYRIRVTGKTPDAGDASILFSIGTESTKQEDSLSEAEPLASPSATPERTENDFILSLVSPADGNEIDPAETADVQFLWVLDEDEKAGHAPEDVNERRAVYKQLQPDYVAEGKYLNERLEKLDNPFITTYPLSKSTLIGYLETAVSLLEVYQAMFDYLMSGDGSEQPEADREKERSPRETDFSAMFDLFKGGKNNLPN